MKAFWQNNNIEMYLRHNERKYLVAGRFIKMTSVLNDFSIIKMCILIIGTSGQN